MTSVLSRDGVAVESTTVRWAPRWHQGGQLANGLRDAMTNVYADFNPAWIDAWATEDAWDALYEWGITNWLTPPDEVILDEPGLAVLVVGYRDEQDDKRGLIGRFVGDVVDKHRIVAARLVTLAVGVTADEWAAARADALTIAAHLER